MDNEEIVRRLANTTPEDTENPPRAGAGFEEAMVYYAAAQSRALIIIAANLQASRWDAERSR